MSDARTIGGLITEAESAYAALQETGESVEDEWTYVTDLAGAWRERLGQVAAARGAEPAPPAVSEAVDRAIAEIGLVTDPHRAIDWLSTFPLVVLVALGEGL